METIEVTREMISKARALEKEVLLHLKRRPNYTGLEVSNRYFVGFLGELAFEKYLQSKGIPYTYDVCTNGQSQKEDFIIELHRPLRVEIKTSAGMHSTCMKIPAYQFPYKNADLYIGIKLSETKAYIYGYCFKKDFLYKADGFNLQKTPTNFADFTSLNPIEYLTSKK